MVNLIKTLIFLFVTSCATTHPSQDSVLGSKASPLTREQALQRSKLVSEVSYDLSINYADHSSFEVTQNIGFQCKGCELPLRLDFSGETPQKIQVNGKPLEPALALTPGQILLPPRFLVEGKNQIEIRFPVRANNSNFPLYRYSESDGTSYFYFRPGPFQLQRLIPSFDQPDLQAKISTEISVPSDWIVVGNFPNQSSPGKGGKNIWKMNGDVPISSHFFSLQMGPFHQWVAKYKQIPLRLLVRKGLADSVDAPTWFRSTQRAIEFMENYLGQPFPHQKLDQTILPNLRFEGYEGYANIVYSEDAIKSGPEFGLESSDQIVELVTHELVHSWFGHLLGPRWWDELWLNEAFATYFAFLILFDGELSGNKWVDFRIWVKDWARYSDIGKKSIAEEVENTDQIVDWTDGVVYGKGAAILRQLNFQMGHSAFRKGLKLYFSKHKNKFASRADLESSLQKYSSFNVNKWLHSAVTERGYPTFRVEKKCERENKITLVVTQVREDLFGPTWKPSKSPPQKVNIGIFTKAPNGQLVKSVKSANFNDSNQKIHLAASCDSVILLNEGDYSYNTFFLSSDQLNEAKKIYGLVPSEIDRVLLWDNARELFLRGEISFYDFRDFTIFVLERESSFRVLRRISYFASYHPWGVQSGLSSLLPSSSTQAEDFRVHLENYFLKKLSEKSSNSQERVHWWLQLVQSASQVDSINYLISVLENHENGLKVGGHLSQGERDLAQAKICQKGLLKCKDLLGFAEVPARRDKGIKQEIKSIFESQEIDLGTKKDFLNRLPLLPAFQRSEDLIAWFFSEVYLETNLEHQELLDLSFDYFLLGLNCTIPRREYVSSILEGKKFPGYLSAKIARALEWDRFCQRFRENTLRNF